MTTSAAAIEPRAMGILEEPRLSANSEANAGEVDGGAEDEDASSSAARAAGGR
jgi:hypothetical protein